MDAEADRRPKDRAHISHIPRINKYQLRPGSIQLLRIFLKYTDNKNILLVAQAGNKLVVYGQGNTAGAAESGKLLCIGKTGMDVDSPHRRSSAFYQLDRREGPERIGIIRRFLVRLYRHFCFCFHDSSQSAAQAVPCGRFPSWLISRSGNFDVLCRPADSRFGDQCVPPSRISPCFLPP